MFEVSSYVGRTLVAALSNGTVITADLLAVERDRMRVRHVMGGGAAAYWIARDQVVWIRPAR